MPLNANGVYVDIDVIRSHIKTLRSNLAFAERHGQLTHPAAKQWKADLAANEAVVRDYKKSMEAYTI